MKPLNEYGVIEVAWRHELIKVEGRAGAAWLLMALPVKEHHGRAFVLINKSCFTTLN